MKEKQNTSSQTIRECDVFISYRREGGDMTAMYFYQALKNRGYNVFYDLEVLRAGKFNEALLDSIQSCTDFVLILSPHALDRCNDESDWVRREIAEALRTHKNIVPVMLKGFSFPEKLPGDIDDVRYQNGLTCTTEYFEESINRLCQRYLNSVPVSEGSGKKKSLVVPIAVVAVIVALAFAGFTFLRGGRQPQSEPTPTAIMEVTAEPTAVADITAEPVPVAQVTAEPAPENRRGGHCAARRRTFRRCPRGCRCQRRFGAGRARCRQGHRLPRSFPSRRGDQCSLQRRGRGCRP